LQTVTFWDTWPRYGLISARSMPIPIGSFKTTIERGFQIIYELRLGLAYENGTIFDLRESPGAS